MNQRSSKTSQAKIERSQQGIEQSLRQPSQPQVSGDGLRSAITRSS